MTPGNISRRSRSEASRARRPAALRLDITPADYRTEYVGIPHEPFENVFHPNVGTADEQSGLSAFVLGLAELQARRTATGAGLIEFLQQNLTQFDSCVGAEIMNLANEVTNDATK
jgi:hypothetical protein